MRKICSVLLLGLVCVCTCAQLSMDEQGWTIVTPSADSRIVYVSSSEGSDANDGLSELTPVETLSKAISMARNGYPDHILFKRGDQWFTKYGLGSFKSGRSATEPMVLGYYGESGARPRFNIENSFFATNSVERSHLVFMGLEIYAYKHDPNSPDFVSTTRVDAMNMLGFGENYLIEDCVFNYTSLGAFAPANGETFYKNVKLRRVISFQSYAPDSYTIHELYTRIQGIYVSNTIGFLVEDCLFDHNGWNEQVDGSGANMFNHNIYMSGHNPDPSKIIIRNNIFARGAAHGVQLRSGGSATGNLFIQNAVNINVGYDYITAGYDDMLQWVENIDNTSVSDNVFMETRLMDSTNSDWPRTGARYGINGISIPCRVHNNIIAHSLNRDGTAIGPYNDVNGIGGTVEKTGNVIHKFYASSTNETPDPGWLDPVRKIAHYHRKLGKEPDTKAFLMEARKRPINTLWAEYSAEHVNSFIRDGFTVMSDDTPPGNTSSVTAANITDASVELSWKWAVDDQRVIGYNVYVNDQKINSGLVYDTMLTVFELEPETAYTVWVKTVDVGENESSGTSLEFFTLEEDLVAPSAPEGLVPIDITDHSLAVSWNPAVDNRAIWGYLVYLDGERWSEQVITDTTGIITGLEMGKKYSITVTALDPSGNESVQGAQLELRVHDSEPPSSPENLSVSDITPSSIVLHWSPATDNVGIAGYQLYLSNAKIDTTSLTEYMFQNLVEESKYRFRVTAIDLDGNESAFATYQMVLGEGQISYDKSFRVFPNPATESVTVVFGAGVDVIEILDIAGSTLQYVDVNGSLEQTLNVNQLERGIYLIRVSGPEGYRVGRFVKN